LLQRTSQSIAKDKKSLCLPSFKLEQADIVLTEQAIHNAKEDPESRVSVVSDETDVFAFVTEHVHQVISKSAQTMRPLKVLRCHGMNCEALRAVYKDVVIAILTYAAPAWWGFTSADDGKRLEAFTQRGVRLGLDKDDEPTLTQLVDKL